MIPVFQDKFLVTDDSGENTQRGNCLQASLASLLELPLDDVPHFVAMEEAVWFTKLILWLEDRKFFLYQTEIWLPNVYGLRIGKSPRGHYNHIVVTCGNELVHDPHPEGGGVGETLCGGEKSYYWYLIPWSPV